MLCFNQEIEKFSILSNCSGKTNPCKSCRVLHTDLLLEAYFFFTIGVLPTEKSYVIFSGWHIDGDFSVGNALIIKKNQWGKFSGREHVPVVGTVM